MTFGVIFFFVVPEHCLQIKKKIIFTYFQIFSIKIPYLVSFLWAIFYVCVCVRARA